MHIRRSKGGFRDTRADSIARVTNGPCAREAHHPAECCKWNSRPFDTALGISVFAGDRRRNGFFDGRRLFGPSKTIRGALASIALTTAVAPLLGLEASIGALAGGMAILGDLFSSFVKRRLGFPPSAQAIGLDQIPEALFPALACSMLFPLGALDIAVVVAGFSIGALLLSPVFYRIGLRDRPF